MFDVQFTCRCDISYLCSMYTFGKIKKKKKRKNFLFLSLI